MNSETNSNPAAAHKAPLMVFPSTDASAVQPRGALSIIRQLGIDFVRRWTRTTDPAPAAPATDVSRTDILIEVPAIPEVPATPIEATMEVETLCTGVPVADGNSSFIDAYADWADILESPRIMHEAVAMQLVAAVLNRNGVHFYNGAIHYSFDLWLALISKSGGGRNTLTSMAYPVLKSASLSDLITNTDWGSKEATYETFASVPASFYIWGEMSHLLKKLNSPMFDGVKGWLTNCFDEYQIPQHVRYRHQNKPNDQRTADIVFKSPPRTNFLALSSDAWFFSYLKEEDTTGGFLARWVIIRAGSRARSVPLPPKMDMQQAERLGQWLRQIASLKGEADLSGIVEDYATWYQETQKRFEARENVELANAFFNRFKGLVLKLAVVREASVSGTLKVSDDAWHWSKTKAKELEEIIFSMMATGMTGAGFAQQRMELVIQSAGPEGIPRWELSRAFQDQKERWLSLNNLLRQEKVFLFKRPGKDGKGRTGDVYVHFKHYEAAVALYGEPHVVSGV